MRAKVFVVTVVQDQQLVAHTRWIVDRGPRPRARGWYHAGAAFLAAVSGAVLTTFSWMTLPWLFAIGVTVYAVALLQLYGVSAAYHCVPWRSARAVEWWKWADHSTIALFIAATYTPMALMVLSAQAALWLLAAVWGGALVSVFLSLVSHPRWLDVLLYLAMGWLVLPLIPQLWANAGPTVVWLLFAGGVVYSIGALFYLLRWPGRNALWFGYHEHFHLATVIAGVLHMIAIWMVVVQGA